MIFFTLFRIGCIVDYAGMSHLTPSVHTMWMVLHQITPDSFTSIIHALSLLLALVHRVTFAIIFFFGNLQIFFAGGMAVAGGLSTARSKGKVGSMCAAASPHPFSARTPYMNHL